MYFRISIFETNERTITFAKQIVSCDGVRSWHVTTRRNIMKRAKRGAAEIRSQRRDRTRVQEVKAGGKVAIVVVLGVVVVGWIYRPLPIHRNVAVGVTAFPIPRQEPFLRTWLSTWHISAIYRWNKKFIVVVTHFIRILQFFPCTYMETSIT